jgi:hypothetical protein
VDDVTAALAPLDAQRLIEVERVVVVDGTEGAVRSFPTIFALASSAFTSARTSGGKSGVMPDSAAMARNVAASGDGS